MDKKAPEEYRQHQIRRIRNLVYLYIFTIVTLTIIGLIAVGVIR